jgi:hypothetical protein
VWWEKGVEGYQWKVTGNGKWKAMKFSRLYSSIKVLTIKVRRKTDYSIKSYFVWSHDEIQTDQVPAFIVLKLMLVIYSLIFYCSGVFVS